MLNQFQFILLDYDDEIFLDRKKFAFLRSKGWSFGIDFLFRFFRSFIDTVQTLLSHYFLLILTTVIIFLFLSVPSPKPITAITYLNSFSLEIPVLVNRVCSFDLRMIRTPNLTFPLLGLISKFALSNWTQKQSNSRFGIQLDKNGSVRLHHRTTVVHTELSLSMM